MNSSIRRYPRYIVDFRVKVSFVLQGEAQSATARIRDMSAGGLSVHSPFELPEDTEITLDFFAPGERDPFLLCALVRNRRGFRFGLEFHSLSHEQRAKVQRFCDFLKASGAQPTARKVQAVS